MVQRYAYGEGRMTKCRLERLPIETASAFSLDIAVSGFAIGAVLAV